MSDERGVISADVAGGNLSAVIIAVHICHYVRLARIGSGIIAGLIEEEIRCHDSGNHIV